MKVTPVSSGESCSIKKSKINYFGLGMGVLILLLSQLSHSMNLQDFLNRVQKQNKNFQSMQLQTESSEDKRMAGDMELVPVLGLSYNYLSDKKLPQPSLLADKTTLKKYEASVSKKFSTGTQASFFGNAYDYDFNKVPQPYGKYATGSLGVSLTQSLWRDAFGNGIDLRRQFDTGLSKLEQLQVDAQRRQLLIDAESTFWNYIYLTEEKKQRLSSLERSQKILTWIKKREGDGISDRSDRYNTEALVAARKLELLNSEDDLIAVTTAIRDLMELSSDEKIPELNGDISLPRPVRGQFLAQQNVVRIDAALSMLESRNKKIIAEQVKDTLKPDLKLQASYATNSFEEDMGAATTKWRDNDKPTASIGVNFIYQFDTSVKNARRSSANKDAMAADLKAQRKLLESRSSWEELVRRYEELSKKIQSAQVISEIQGKRLKEEQLKLSRGRSITSNVVTSEEDASDAELIVIKLMAEQRKLEAQTRNYVSTEE